MSVSPEYRSAQQVPSGNAFQDSVPERYMKLLRQFTELVKLPKAECKEKAEHVFAMIEEYRDEHSKIPGHTQRSLDRMENVCRERLGMPLLKRTILEKIVQKLS